MASARARILNAAFRTYLRPRLEGDRDIEQVRGYLDRLAPLAGKPPRGTEIETVDLGSCGAERISAPGSDPHRCLLYFPGGAFVLRSPSIHRAFVARLSREADTPALLTFYRLAPEDPFPAGLDDCLAAYEYLLASGIDASSIVFGGDSAGGCLALATMIALRDAGKPLPAGALLLSPVTDLRNHRNGSRTSNQRSDSMLSMDASEELHRHYVGGSDEALSDPLVSPLLGDLTGLPPLLFHASEDEMLLDDSLLAAERARTAGVACEVAVFPGMPHAWHVIPHLPESKQALVSLGEFVRRSLAGARVHEREEEECITQT